ncbi:MAG: alkaline phosphatase family protein [Prevotella sp.]|nr:alkaline phosphatase family protein [Prevotella sp.]
MEKTTIIRHILLAAIVLGGIATSCTKYDTPPYIEEDQAKTQDGKQAVNRYILWVNIEGAGGGDLVKNNLPDDGAIKGLLPHSRYSWEGLEAEHIHNNYFPTEENAVASASLLTGNMPIRHGIEDNTYISEQVFDPEYDEAMKSYPGFFEYIADYDKNVRTLAITPWRTQNEKLLNKAHQTFTTASDDETMNKALTALQEENNKVIYLSFRGVLDGAKQGGWNANNANYKNALLKMDEYVGNLLEAIRNRENAYFEDWLIIVTSNHGGTADGQYGGSSREERNMFGIFSYDHFSQPKEMDPGMLEVLRFDQSFKGIVIDSTGYTLGSGGNQENIIPRQIYSPDSLGGGMTVEYVMAVRPGVNRSYVGINQNTYSLFDKNRWKMSIGHTYCATYGGFWNSSTGDTNNAGFFVNPYIATFSSAMNFSDVEGYIAQELVNESVDKWGNVIPQHYTYTPKRKGTLNIYSYYNGNLLNSSIGNTKDEKSEFFVDNSNLTIRDEMSNGNSFFWSCRYLLEIRIWNKQLTDSEVKQYSSRLKLTPADPVYKNLIGYWQFYKGENGEYIKDDSLVVNQIPTVNKRVRIGNQIVEHTLNTEPIRLRKKISNGVYTNITRDDVQYTLIPNTLPTVMAEKGRMMESSMVVPLIIEWITGTTTSYPTETTRASSFTASKLDGVLKPYDPVTKTAPWIGQFLGDYSMDLEWRDYE